MLLTAPGTTNCGEDWFWKTMVAIFNPSLGSRKYYFNVDFYQDSLSASPEVSPLVLSNNGKGESRIEVAHVTTQLSSIIPIANQQAVPNLTNSNRYSISKNLTNIRYLKISKLTFR